MNVGSLIDKDVLAFIVSLVTQNAFKIRLGKFCSTIFSNRKGHLFWRENSKIRMSAISMRPELWLIRAEREF